jgi:3-dehydroquinate dehydratase / shikimate dehydrogenase
MQPRSSVKPRRNTTPVSDFSSSVSTTFPTRKTASAAISDFLDTHPGCSILATCRRHQNHGRYNGSIEEQIRILSEATAAGAQAVDVEIETAEHVAAHLDDLRSRALVIISYHNYGGTPALDSLVRRMGRIAADGYKIVTTARKPSDNFRVLNLTRTFGKTKLIVLAMGEIGFPTRVLSTAFGGLYTYAAPNASDGTASGQVCARTLRHLYRVEKFSRNAKVYGVIADPVRHSVSPAVHNRAFQARRLDSVYLPFLVNPLHLKDFFTFADKLPIAGFSVTIPHKQKVLRYLEIVDPLARRIGAVNTVWKKRVSGAALTPTPKALPCRSAKSCASPNRASSWPATAAQLVPRLTP